MATPHDFMLADMKAKYDERARNDQILWMVSGVVGVRNAPSRG